MGHDERQSEGSFDLGDARARVREALALAGRADKTVGLYDSEIRRFSEWWDGVEGEAPVEADMVRYLAEERGLEVGSLGERAGTRSQRDASRAMSLLLQAVSGEVDVTRPAARSSASCPERWSGALDGYVEACEARGNAEASVHSKAQHARRFLAWAGGVVDGLGDLGTMEVTGYFLTLKGRKRKGVAMVATCLRDLLRHLESEGLVREGLADAVPHPRVIRNETVPRLWSAEDVRGLLGAIDRSSAIGKRDYAFLLLVARLGLRTTDVRNLEVSSIDWARRELRITQRKTGVPLTLPLLDDVGWAVIDYLRDGRPESEAGRGLVFVSHRWPYGRLGGPSALVDRLYVYSRKAGIEFEEGRLHGLHSLRGSLARAMLSNGAPVPVISQTLGHVGCDTTAKYYLRLDLDGMRGCAADVEDVARGDGDGDGEEADDDGGDGD